MSKTPSDSLQRASSLAIGAGLLVTSLWTRAAIPSGAAVTRDALAAGFDAGIRNLVVEWDAQDPRPEAERRKALFDFMYQSFQASAWIPQSLFDSNLVTQAVVGDVDTIVGDKVGLVLWRDNPRVPAFGMAPNAGEHDPVKWTVNCLVCHMAEIDGVAYLGAGTKTFDEVWLGEALKRLTGEPWRGRLGRGSKDYDARGRRQPDSEQPSPRQDRFADARPLHGIRGVARRDVHAIARQRAAGGGRRRPRRRQDPAAVAHRRQDARQALVHGRQFSRSLPADGVVDGAEKRSLVRRAGPGRRADDQGRVHIGHPSSPAAALSVRDRSRTGRAGT